MTNPEAADVLREYIRTNKPCNGLEMALQKAITALEHQPEPQLITGESYEFYDPIVHSLQCLNCHAQTTETKSLLCHNCGSSDLRPVYVSEIGRKA